MRSQSPGPRGKPDGAIWPSSVERVASIVAIPAQWMIEAAGKEGTTAQAKP